MSSLTYCSLHMPAILRNLAFESDACRAEIAAQKGVEALLEVQEMITV